MRIFIATTILFFNISCSSGLKTTTSTWVYPRYVFHNIKYHIHTLRNKQNEGNTHSVRKREILSTLIVSPLLSFASLFLNTPNAQAKSVIGRSNLFEVNKPQTYIALAYTPKKRIDAILIVLHDASKNELDISNLLNIRGEYSGLAPILTAAGKYPPELYNDVIGISPYS